MGLGTAMKTYSGISPLRRDPFGPDQAAGPIEFMRPNLTPMQKPLSGAQMFQNSVAKGLGSLAGGALGNWIGSGIGGLIGKLTDRPGGPKGSDIGGAIGSTLGGFAGGAFFRKGGKVKRTGPAFVHKGEYVLPKGVKPTRKQVKAVAKKKKKRKK